MRVGKMTLRRTERAIISWDGSHDDFSTSYLWPLSGRGSKKSLTPKIGGGSGWGTWFTFGFHLSRLMRLWHLSPSVNSIFKHACAAIQWGYTSDFRSDSLPTSFCVRTAKALARLRGCTGSPEPSLFAYARSTIISWAGSNICSFGAPYSKTA